MRPDGTGRSGARAARARGKHNPPELLVAGTIAVEVWRLNQNERGRDSPKDLEEVSIPFMGRLESSLTTFGAATTASWYVTLRLKRPRCLKCRTVSRSTGLRSTPNFVRAGHALFEPLVAK